MLGFGLLVSIPALIISRLISPRRRYNPVKFLPMECGQVPSGEGRTHFMMQVLCLHFDVCRLRCYGYFPLCLGGLAVFVAQNCYFTDNWVLGDNVRRHGVLIIFGGEEGNLVARKSLTINKYLASRGGVRVPG